MADQVDLDKRLKELEISFREEDLKRMGFSMRMEKQEMLRRAIEIASSAYTRFNGVGVDDNIKDVQATLKKVVITASKKLDDYLANI